MLLSLNMGPNEWSGSECPVDAASDGRMFLAFWFPICTVIKIGDEQKKLSKVTHIMQSNNKLI